MATLKAKVGNVFSQRLVQFILLGGALFAALPSEESKNEVVIFAADLAAYEDARKELLGVTALTQAQKAEVAQQLEDDELLYREAIRLGLDKSDHVVKRRIVQKLLFIVQDLTGASGEPSESELREYHQANRAKWPDEFDTARSNVALQFHIDRRDSELRKFISRLKARYSVIKEDAPSEPKLALDAAHVGGGTP